MIWAAHGHDVNRYRPFLREACLILDLSPKSSATLARRCLQGMIRDFWEIKKDRLIDEINELEARVQADVWEAIKAVKDVGNIGAHMEKDIDLIIEVDPGEVRLLIQLIEQLFDEWYIARYERGQRMRSVVNLAKGKKEQRKQGKAAKAVAAPAADLVEGDKD